MRGRTILSILVTPLLLSTALAAYGGHAVRADDPTFPAAAQQAIGSPGDGTTSTGALLDQTGSQIAPTGVTLQTHVSSVGTPGLSGDQLPAQADLSKYNPPVGSQGGVNSCVSWAVGYYLAGWWAKYLGYYPAAGPGGLDGFAPMFVYSQVSQGKNVGTTIGATMSVLQQQGIDAESHYTQGTQDYTDAPTSDEAVNAGQYKIASYQDILKPQLDDAHISPEDAIRTYIANGSPVVIALNVDTAFQLDGNSGYSYFGNMNGTLAGGHAMFASAYDANGLWVENSWGTNWGHNGYAELSWDLINSDVLEIGTLLPGAVRAPIPVPAGGQVAAVTRNDHQEDAFFVGSDGTLFTTFEGNDGPWSAPIALTAAGAAPPGAPVAAVVRNDHQEDVFYVGSDSKLYTLFEVNDGPWSAPAALTTTRHVAIRLSETLLGGGPVRVGTLSVLAPGAHLAAIVRDAAHANQEDVFFIGTDGSLYTLTGINDPSGSTWSSPSPITPAGVAPSGASVAAVLRNGSQEDVFYAGTGGVLYTTFAAIDGPWSAPIALTHVPNRICSLKLTRLGGGGCFGASSVVPAGAAITAVMRNSSQEDVFFNGTLGKISTVYEDNNGAWSAPVALTGINVLPTGGSLTVSVRNDHQEDLFYVGTDGLLYTTYEVSGGPWSAPIALSTGAVAPAGAAIAATVRNDHQEDLFFAGGNAELATAFEANDGPWAVISPVMGFSLG